MYDYDYLSLGQSDFQTEAMRIRGDEFTTCEIVRELKNQGVVTKFHSLSFRAGNKFIQNSEGARCFAVCFR